METCETVHTRWSMKQEIVDDLENYDEINDDIIREICDGLVPAYNSELIDHCAHYQGSEFWDIWYGNELGGETPIDTIRGNLFCLYLEIGAEVLAEVQAEEE